MTSRRLGRQINPQRQDTSNSCSPGMVYLSAKEAQVWK